MEGEKYSISIIAKSSMPSDAQKFYFTTSKFIVGHNPASDLIGLQSVVIPAPLDPQKSVISFTIPKGCKYIMQYSTITTGKVKQFKELMLIKGVYTKNTIPQYTPYQSSSIQLPLLSQTHLNGIEPLRCAGEVADEVDWDRGKIIRRVGKVILDGSGAYSFNDVLSTPIYSICAYNITNMIGLAKDKLKCDKLSVAYTSTSNCIYGSYATYVYMSVSNVALGIISGDTNSIKQTKFINYVKANNIMIHYPLATPIETDIPPEILNQYLMSYTNKTYISSINYVQPTLKLDTLEEPISRKLFDDMVSKKLVESSGNSCVSESIDYKGNIKGVEGCTVKNLVGGEHLYNYCKVLRGGTTIVDVVGVKAISTYAVNTDIDLCSQSYKPNTQYAVRIDCALKNATDLNGDGTKSALILIVEYLGETKKTYFISVKNNFTEINKFKTYFATTDINKTVESIYLTYSHTIPYFVACDSICVMEKTEYDKINGNVAFGLNSIGQPSTLTIDNNGAKTELYDTEGNPIVLGAVGDIKDTWNSDGSITLRTKEMAITGRESWTYNATYHVFIASGAIPYPITSQPASGFCDRYKVVSGGSIAAVKEKECAWHVEGNFCVKDNATYTIETWIAYLKQQDALGTPLTIRYQLATPITIYPQTTNFPTYAGTNTVKVSGAVLPPSLAVEFPQSAAQTEENIVNRVVKLLPTAVVKEMVDSSYTEATNKINNI